MPFILKRKIVFNPAKIFSIFSAAVVAVVAAPSLAGVTSASRDRSSSHNCLMTDSVVYAISRRSSHTAAYERSFMTKTWRLYGAYRGRGPDWRLVFIRIIFGLLIFLGFCMRQDYGFLVWSVGELPGQLHAHISLQRLRGS